MFHGTQKKISFRKRKNLTWMTIHHVTLRNFRQIFTYLALSDAVFLVLKAQNHFVFIYFWKYLIRYKKGKRANHKTGVSKKKQSTPNFSKNEYFLTPDTHLYVCVSGVKKCSFFGKFGVLCFLETPILRFVLLPYYRRTSWNRKKNTMFIADLYRKYFTLGDSAKFN